MAIGRHHVRRQRVQEQRHVAGVIGQRGDGVGILGEGDQRHLPAAALPQQGRELGARLREARGRQVAGQRGERQVQRHHQRLPCLPQRDRLLAQARASHRDERQGERRQRGPAAPWPHGLAVALAVQQVRQQVRIHHLPPALPLACRAPQGPGQQRQREQAQQPPRAQDMQLRQGLEHRVHRRRPAASASRPTSSAAPSGHG